MAAVISLGRFVFGAAFIARPKILEGAWIGKQARLPGARDLTLGLGGLQAAARDDGSIRPWLAAAAICDAVDFGATYAAGRRIPRQGRNGVLTIASVASLLSGIAAAASGTKPQG